MHPLRRTLFLFQLTILFIVICSQPVIAGKKVAFLVGVNKYLKPGFSDLDYAENDVLEVAQELRKLGFDVTLLLGSKKGNGQATLENIKTTINKLVSPLTKSDLMIVMLAGHGQQLVTKEIGPNNVVTQREDSFFCPVDAIKSEPTKLFSLSYLIDKVLAPNVGRKLVLIDACRDEPKDAGRGSRGVQGRFIALPEETAVLFSCKAGQQSSENDLLKHGLFTHCVLEGLRGEAARYNEISWGDLSAYVTRRMASRQFRQYISEHRPQTPIPAGGVTFTPLGNIDEKEIKDVDYELALKFYMADGQNKDDKKALELFRKAAGRGHALAKTFVGFYHIKGMGIPINIEEGKRWYASALPELREMAEKGDPLAQTQYSKLFETGAGVTQSNEEAIKWLRIAAEQGYPMAMLNLGYRYNYAKGIELDYEEALKWYRKAASAGSVSAMYNLGVMYGKGRGVEKDSSEAIEWYKKAIAKGSASAMYNLGIMYRDGEGVSQNYEKALNLFRQSAKQNYKSAIYLIGKMYQDGEGVSEDNSEALKWYRKAADLGVPDAQFMVGYFYSQGIVVQQDMKKAVIWYEKASDQNVAAAQVNLGIIYDTGKGEIEEDDKAALKWYRIAAEQGDASGQYNLALMYRDGTGIERDYRQALKWFKKAANQGKLNAIDSIGTMYDKGRGLRKDSQEAIRWYKKSAEKNYAYSQNNLGLIYSQGRSDVPVDKKEAIKWFRLAAKSSTKSESDYAKKKLRELGETP